MRGVDPNGLVEIDRAVAATAPALGGVAEPQRAVVAHNLASDWVRTGTVRAILADNRFDAGGALVPGGSSGALAAVGGFFRGMAANGTPRLADAFAAASDRGYWAARRAEVAARVRTATEKMSVVAIAVCLRHHRRLRHLMPTVDISIAATLVVSTMALSVVGGVGDGPGSSPDPWRTSGRPAATMTTPPGEGVSHLDPEAIPPAKAPTDRGDASSPAAPSGSPSSPTTIVGTDVEPLGAGAAFDTPPPAEGEAPPLLCVDYNRLGDYCVSLPRVPGA